MISHGVINFILAVVSLKEKYEFSVTSWIRSAKRNHEVGGKSSSYHLLGLGVDCLLDAPTYKDSFIKDAKRLGLDAVDEGDHVHLEPSDI